MKNPPAMGEQSSGARRRDVTTIDHDITASFAADDRPRIVTNRALDCRVHLVSDPESIVRDIGVCKPQRDFRHAAGT